VGRCSVGGDVLLGLGLELGVELVGRPAFVQGAPDQLGLGLGARPPMGRSRSRLVGTSAADRVGLRPLKGQLDLKLHGTRSLAGVTVRVAQRLLALAATIWHNRATGRSQDH
jgi:hypothetical protein